MFPVHHDDEDDDDDDYHDGDGEDYNDDDGDDDGGDVAVCVTVINYSNMSSPTPFHRTRRRRRQ